MTADDRTPAFLQSIGIGPGEWFQAPKPVLEALIKRGSTPPHVKVWACGVLHTFGYQDQGELALKLVNGRKVPLTPSDISRETGITNQNVRRALAQLERQGLVYRTLTGGRLLRELDVETRHQLHGRVQIHFYARPDERQNSDAPRKPPDSTAWMLHRIGIDAQPDLLDNPELEHVITRIYSEFQRDLSSLKSHYRQQLKTSLKVVGTDHLKYSARTAGIPTAPYETKQLGALEKKVKESERRKDPAGERAGQLERDARARPDARPPARLAGSQGINMPEKIQTDSDRNFHQRLSQSCTRYFGVPPTVEQSEKIRSALQGADIAQLVQLVERRTQIRSWGGVLKCLAPECARGQEAWRRSRGQGPQRTKRQEIARRIDERLKDENG